MSEPQFDLDRAREYWRHAPAGADKLDTRAFAEAAVDARVWDRGFRSRMLNYPEEEQFVRSFAARCGGRRIVSIGSGLGFHELYYASAGADVVCCDIVPSNLAVVAAVARAKKIPVQTFCRADLAAEPLPGAADIVFVYGCLMHMPGDAQRRLVARAAEALRPGGSIVFMVYAWEFARRSCGWIEPSQFDPVVFAHASDPTVGREACPWSDWHDDAKLLDLAGSGGAIVRRQPWNDFQYFWYEVGWPPRRRRPEPFFSPRALESGVEVARIDPRDFNASEAKVSRWWRRSVVRMPASHASYALVSPPRTVPGANAVSVDVSIRQGAISVGLLDAAAQKFVATAVVATRGRRRVLLLADPVPQRFSIVISNHQPKTRAPGAFALYGARVLRREIATLAAAGANAR